MGNCLHKKTAEAKDTAKTIQPNYEKTFPEVIKKDSIVSNSCIEPNILKEKLSKNQGLDFPRIPEHEPIQIAKRGATVIRSYGLNNFPYSVLKTATQKFSKSNIIGSGGFGDVYKAWIDPITMNAAKPGYGRIIAVKKLRKAGDQGHNEWQNEADFLSQFHHPNIVKLIGYCSDGKERILVYEYMARGNLEAYLIRECGYGLTWARRLKIAIGAARGLAYLHNSRKPVIHRDFKASNILLDMDLNPKLSDFGLAKYGPQGDKSHISTRILGTRGYFAPEYVATGHLTIRTDIYSFGVVLLEIFCGCGAIRKHTDGMAGDLAVWAKPYLSNRLQLSRVIDRKLRKHLCLEQACEFANIILQCLDHDAKKRPTMNQVVISLEELYIACSRTQALDECNSFTL